MLAEEYLRLCGLDLNGIFGVSAAKLSQRLTNKKVDTDDIRHAADCFDAVARAMRDQGLLAHASLWALWSHKFFNVAGAPLSLVRVGQDIADDILGVTGSPQDARDFIEMHLLPAVKEFGLAERAISVRSQYAVVCAHCGDFSRADAEMRAIEPYVAGLPPAIQSEIENQLRLISELRIRSLTPGKGQRATGVGSHDPCPCGSGKKFKKCCGAG